MHGRWTPLFSADEYLGTHYSHRYWFKCETCKCEFETSLFNFHRDKLLICPGCKQTNKSIIQHEFANEIRQLTNQQIIVQEEVTGILSGKQSLDIYLPELKLAIEFNRKYLAYTQI